MMPKTTNRPRTSALPEQGSARSGLLAVVSFLLGVAAAAAWFHVTAKPPAAVSVQQIAPAPEASEATGPASGAPPAPSQSFVEQPVPVSSDAVEALKRALPNYANLSVEDGTEILREAALKQFAAAAQELQSEVGKAENELADAQNSKSAADQQAAMKHLEQVQAEQEARLKEIAGNLQTQIAALKQLKNGQ